MFFSEYQRLAMRTANIDKSQPLASLVNWGLGVAEEGGEVAGLVKKWKYHKHELKKEKFVEEVGDVLWYCAAVCESLGLQLGDVAAANIKKLQLRYEDGFSPEASINRKD